eukprot:6205611-Pleurochrysis_carterae.AAC.2
MAGQCLGVRGKRSTLCTGIDRSARAGAIPCRKDRTASSRRRPLQTEGRESLCRLRAAPPGSTGSSCTHNGCSGRPHAAPSTSRNTVRYRRRPAGRCHREFHQASFGMLCIHHMFPYGGSFQSGTTPHSCLRPYCTYRILGRRRHYNLVRPCTTAYKCCSCTCCSPYICSTGNGTIPICTTARRRNSRNRHASVECNAKGTRSRLCIYIDHTVPCRYTRADSHGNSRRLARLPCKAGRSRTLGICSTLSNALESSTSLGTSQRGYPPLPEACKLYTLSTLCTCNESSALDSSTSPGTARRASPSHHSAGRNAVVTAARLLIQQQKLMRYQVHNGRYADTSPANEGD